MKGKLLKDISNSAVQVILNQALGLVVFLVLSRYLSKEVYGEMNWSLAVLLFITTLLSFRLEQIVTRNIAAGQDAAVLLTAFAGHVLVSGLLFYAVLLTGSWLFPSFFNHHYLLLVLAISQLLGFFSLPFKQVAAGRQDFAGLALMSSIANLIRCSWLLVVVVSSGITIRGVLLVFIISSAAELVAAIYLLYIRCGITLQPAAGGYYIQLLRESLPQLGVVFLNACIARIDWILLGLLASQAATAEYSFAYRIFELSPLPLLVLAPVLLSRFAAMVAHGGARAVTENKSRLSLLVRMQMVAATLLPMLLNIAWVPLIDGVTGGKYGAVNSRNFFLLSCCIPFQYGINLLWTIHFSLNRLAFILRATLVTCVIIVAGNIVLIPAMNATGAAIAYLIAMITEYLLYLYRSPFFEKKILLQPLLTGILAALASGLPLFFMAVPLFVKLSGAAVIYLALTNVMGLMRKEDLAAVWQFARASLMRSKLESR
jgi:O-antigen/teichoic acid export membrane protein